MRLHLHPVHQSRQLAVRRAERDGKARMLAGSAFSIPRKRRRRRVSLLPATNSSQDGWRCEGGKPDCRVPKIKQGVPPGKCETGKDDAGGSALQCGLGSVCSRQSQRKGSNISVLVERLHAEHAAFLSSAGGTCPSCTRVQHLKEEKCKTGERSKLFLT